MAEENEKQTSSKWKELRETKKTREESQQTRWLANDKTTRVAWVITWNCLMFLGRAAGWKKMHSNDVKCWLKRVNYIVSLMMWNNCDNNSCHLGMHISTQAPQLEIVSSLTIARRQQRDRARFLCLPEKLFKFRAIIVTASANTSSAPYHLSVISFSVQTIESVAENRSGSIFVARLWTTSRWCTFNSREPRLVNLENIECN